MAASVWDMQRCTSCCSHATLASPGHGSFEFSEAAASHQSPFLAGGLGYGGVRRVKMDTSRGGKQPRRLAATRSLYSPLVESFEGMRNKPGQVSQTAKDSDSSSTTSASSPSSASTGPAPARRQHASREQRGSEIEQRQEENGDIHASPQDPIAAAYGDDTRVEKMADIGHDLDAKRSARARPPSMSLSQGFSSVGRRAVTHTVGAVGRPLSSAKIKGPAGVVMALAVAALGLKTAAEKQGLLSSSTPQKVCDKCDGYGVQQCHVCRGTGKLVWEGKLRHTDPCPLCFGSCVKKCANCGGTKMKKGMPPAIAAQKSSKG